MIARSTMLALGALIALFGGPTLGHEAPHLVALTMYVTLDRVAADPDGAPHGKVGDMDRIRLTYDPGAVDPASHRVTLINFQHWMNGHYLPPHPDPVMMPVTDSWLDLSQTPYRLHFRAAVVHGEPIVIEVSEDNRRLTIYRQGDPKAVLLSGAYWIDPTHER
jgi:hypothetical protein